MTDQAPSSPTGTAPDHVDIVREQWAHARPELDSSPLAVIARLHRVANALTERLVAVYRRFGLSEPEFDLLATLRRSNDRSELLAGDLAAHTMVTTGGLTKRVDRLVDRGLVERVGTMGDGRRRSIRLTAAGRTLIDEAVAAHFANERRLLDRLGPDDAAVLEPILRRWMALLEQNGGRDG